MPHMGVQTLRPLGQHTLVQLRSLLEAAFA